MAIKLIKRGCKKLHKNSLRVARLNRTLFRSHQESIKLYSRTTSHCVAQGKTIQVNRGRVTQDAGELIDVRARQTNRKRFN